MGFPDDLLEQAYHLARRDGDTPRQASLRRAVSTAYYALFHLLIDEAVGNWSIARHRSALARTFDHDRMKKVCDEQIKAFYNAGRPDPGQQLKDVAQTFVDLQRMRHSADYENSHAWTPLIAEDWIGRAAIAFADWRAINSQEESQDFLLQLFFSKLLRQ